MQSGQLPENPFLPCNPIFKVRKKNHVHLCKSQRLSTSDHLKKKKKKKKKHKKKKKNRIK